MNKFGHKISRMSKNRSQLLFLFLLLIVSFFYDYQEIIFKRPQSVHAWRQSDCASLALNYSEEGMRFFQPETHNLTSDNGTSGKAATSETPLLYYGVALLYKIFGSHEFLYRIFNTLIFLMGLFFLFRLVYEQIHDFFWSAFLPLLLFSSPVITYYANNFLSDSTALSMVFIGWFFFFRFSKGGRHSHLYWSMFFFGLAMSLKITAGLSLFAIGGIFLLESVFRLKILPGKGKVFPNPQKFLISAILSIIPALCWIIYAAHYNSLHGSTYFSTTTFPLWELKKDEIMRVIENIRKIWLSEYFHFSAYSLFALCIAYFLFHLRRITPLILYITLFLGSGVIAFVLLQFWTFRDHDYYTINLYIFPAFLLLLFIDSLYRYHTNLASSVFIKILFSIILIVNIFHAKSSLKERYEGWFMEPTQTLEAFYTISPYLREIGIEQGDTVISMAGNSHVSLYLMDLKGWTEHTDKRLGREENVSYNQDSAGIARSISNGAKYLIINGITQIYEKPFLQPYLKNLKGNYRGLLIFGLAVDSTNYHVEKLVLKSKLHCDAETLDETGSFFIGSPDNVLLEFGNLRTNKSAHSGSYSLELNEENPYGMTLVIPPLDFADKLTISAMVMPNNKEAGIIISALEINDFYHNECHFGEVDSRGWTPVSTTVYIDSQLEGQPLKVYLYNPGAQAVYFDDLEITRYGLAN